MKNIVKKSVYAIAVLSVIVLACSNTIFQARKQKTYVGIIPHFDKNGYWKTDTILFKLNPDKSVSYYGTESLYGAYLAGRVAHLRQDFDNAAEYYKIAFAKDSANSEINTTIYVLLTAIGQIDDAFPFAKQEMKTPQSASIAPLIVAVKDFADGKYAQVRTDIEPLLNDNIYKNLISPLFKAWSYAGENDETQAINSVNQIIDDEAFKVLKLYHKGMLYDYLGNKEKAGECYNNILKNHYQKVTYRMLEIITDYYTRIGQKELARKIATHYQDNGLISILLSSIDKHIDTTAENSTAIINTPQKGLAEAMFNIGVLYRMFGNGSEFAQIYTAASAYLNPEYDIAKIALANILEEGGLLKEANKYYARIDKNSSSYFIARMKIIENLNKLENYSEAEKYLRDLLKEHPDNTQLLTDLGNIQSNLKNHDEAIRLYKKALASVKEISYRDWPIYYALAISYDHNKQTRETIENLQKALELSNRDANVLNYLGYWWLLKGENTDEALRMILEAYEKIPYEGHIIDSVGWVYFKVGMYDKAIEFLEQASAINPGNAVINDHLGDAYWLGNRKNEAVFQWKHALVLKEDAELLDKEEIRAKLKNGIENIKIIKVQDLSLLKRLKDLKLSN